MIFSGLFLLSIHSKHSPISVKSDTIIGANAKNNVNVPNNGFPFLFYYELNKLNFAIFQG